MQACSNDIVPVCTHICASCIHVHACMYKVLWVEFGFQVCVKLQMLAMQLIGLHMTESFMMTMFRPDCAGLPQAAITIAIFFFYFFGCSKQ